MIPHQSIQLLDDIVRDGDSYFFNPEVLALLRVDRGLFLTACLPTSFCQGRYNSCPPCLICFELSGCHSSRKVEVETKRIDVHNDSRQTLKGRENIGRKDKP